MAGKRRKRSKKLKALHVIQPNAAGIDVGTAEIYGNASSEDSNTGQKPWNFSWFRALKRREVT